MRYTEGYIPPNLGGGTVFGGMFKIRNVIEAAIVGLTFYFLGVILQKFIPMIIATAVSLVLGGGFAFVAAIGINGEPLSIFILNIINYSNGRNFVTLRPPQRELEIPNKKKESRFDAFVNNLFTPGEKPEKKKNSKKKAKKK